MANLKKLQEMAKNGKISKNLLDNKEFKANLKKILEEEGGVQVPDEDIPEIIKHLETALQDESILNEAAMETVSGGHDYTTRQKAYLAGAIGGGTAGAIGLTAFALSRCENWKKALKKECKRYNKAVMRNRINAIYDKEFGTTTYNVPPELQAGPIHTSGSVGLIAGAGIGLGVAHLICNAVGVE